MLCRHRAVQAPPLAASPGVSQAAKAIWRSALSNEKSAPLAHSEGGPSHGGFAMLKKEPSELPWQSSSDKFAWIPSAMHVVLHSVRRFANRVVRVSISRSV